MEACLKQLQALQANKKQSERARSARRKLRCWCCKAEGHLLRACPVVQQNKAAYCKQKAEQQRVPDGANGCQIMQKVPMGAEADNARGCQRVEDGTRECQRVPEGARWFQWVPDDAKVC